MTTEEPNVSLTGRYSIGEASALLGVSRNTLRGYADRGLIRFGIRRESMRRFFEGREILRFWKACY